jgi:DNA-binding beta-propeller fold protein YncE
MKPLRALALAAILSGCGRAIESPDILIIGGPGSTDGRFATPRAAAWDPSGRLYVVDKTGRVQAFDGEGRVLRVWKTPAVELGRPGGVAVDLQGHVLVADTHYHQVLRYSPDGELLSSFGSEGRGPGQFIYPVGLAIAPDGTIYVSEFGGNDRIQAFDSSGRFRFEWGRYGDAPGEFKRPQGLAWAGGRLYAADAVNDRVQVFSPEGEFLLSWSGLRYPYSVSVDREDNILVAEYGRDRISRFSPDGRPLGGAGGSGAASGFLNRPWSAVAAGDRVYVVDSENHRVQRWPLDLLKAVQP